MPRFHLVSLAFRDLADDVAYHGGNLIQGAFDFTCLVAVVATLYAASMDGGADTFAPRPKADAQASVTSLAPAADLLPATCVALTEPAAPLGHGCITSQVLADGLGT